MIRILGSMHPCTKGRISPASWPVAATLSTSELHDLHKRVFQHKWKEEDGFTARYNCYRLVWFEGHDDVTKAIGREKTLKGWKRIRKIELIESVNPAWIDLSREWYDCEPADYARAFDRMNS